MICLSLETPWGLAYGDFGEWNRGWWFQLGPLIFSYCPDRSL